MKQRIILGFSVIVALLVLIIVGLKCTVTEIQAQTVFRKMVALPVTLFGNAKAEDCVPVPEIWTKSFEECANELSLEHFRELSHRSTENRAVKCFPVCLYGKIDYFKDGQFSSETIEVFIREHVTHSLMERHLALTTQAAETANEVEGDECDKAYKFWLLNGEEELEALQTDTYCPMDFSQEFADRYKLNAHK